MIDPERVRQEFIEEFGGHPRLFAAPGRVNLIGEHTDYNDGFVLPFAIDRQTIAAAETRDDRRVRVHSANVGETVEFDLDAEGKGRRGMWLDYVEGTARVLEARGHHLRGANLLVHSDVPEGAGLSSSAALEISTGFALLSLTNAIAIDRVALALAAQEAEHTFVGTQSGIMDQYVAVRGEYGHALLIDCRHLDSDTVPIDTDRVAIAICDTSVKHELAGSEYNTRRKECELAVEILRSALPNVRALRDVTLVQFEQHGHLLPEPLFRRVRHVVTENVRTLSASIALRAMDFEKVGRLMLGSHLSLRDDYEVSVRELDVLVEAAEGIEGVYGARMTGGGFGGSAIALMRPDVVDRFRHRVEERYREETGRHATIYMTGIADGARELPQ